MDYDLSLHSLKKNCTINVDDIVKLVRNINLNLMSATNEPIKELVENVYAARTQLDIIIQNLLAKLHDTTVCKEKADESIYYDLRLNLARIIGHLDVWETETIKKVGGKIEMTEVDRVNILGYIQKLNAVLYGCVLYPLKDASREEPSDKRAFLYNLCKRLDIVAGTFGAPTREKLGLRKGEFNIPPSLGYKKLLEPEKQKELGEQFDKELDALREDDEE